MPQHTPLIASRKRHRYRILDLSTGRTLVVSTYGRDLVAYHDRYHRDTSQWEWQYEHKNEWVRIPGPVIKKWRKSKLSKDQADRRSGRHWQYHTD